MRLLNCNFYPHFTVFFPRLLSAFEMSMFWGNIEAAMMTTPCLAGCLHIGPAMTTNDDTSSRKLYLFQNTKQPCITFSRGKVHLYALFGHGMKCLWQKILYFSTPTKGVEVLSVWDIVIWMDLELSSIT